MSAYREYDNRTMCHLCRTDENEMEVIDALKGKIECKDKILCNASKWQRENMDELMAEADAEMHHIFY